MGIDLLWLNGNYQRALFHYVKKCSADRLRQVAQPRRQAALVCFLWQSYRDTVDQMIDMYDKLLTKVQTHAQNELDQQLKRQRQSIQTSLSMFRSLVQIILDDSVRNDQVRERLFEAIPKDQLAAQVEGLAQWVSGRMSELFHGVVKRFGYLRQFSPAFLRAVQFVQESEGGQIPCLEAIQTLNGLNADNKRKIPADATTDFIPERLLPIVKESEGHIDKQAWECALLIKVRDEIKSGNISVKHSKRFGRFSDFFIPDQRWQAIKEAFFRKSGLPQDPGDVPDYLHNRLDQAYDRFLQTAPNNTYATTNETGWHLSTEPTEKLDPELQRKLDHFRQ